MIDDLAYVNLPGGRVVTLNSLLDKQRLIQDIIDVLEHIEASDSPSTEAAYAIMNLKNISQDHYGDCLGDAYLNLATHFLRLKGIK